MTRELNSRWPLVLWRTIPVDDISDEVAAMLLDRGLAPALPLQVSSINAAIILQASGVPVVLTAGGGVGTSWPYDLERNESLWAYKFDELPSAQTNTPVPTLFSGWSIAASQIRNIMASYREAGVTVDAAWLDYEGLPFQANYIDAVTSLNGKEYLPSASLANPRSFYHYTRRLWINLLSTYIAAPIREIYPKASVTNWLAVLSLPEYPARSWYGDALPMVGPTMFTATNPVAYGIDTAFNSLIKVNSMTTQRDVDRAYTKILLRQVSADSYAINKIAPELNSVVWVARWVRDDPSKLTPMMSRSAYREALRHLWLRGVDAMHIFSPIRKGFTESAIQEIEDAVAVFDEMLEFNDFIEAGEIIQFNYGINNQNPVLWSGLRTENRAIIRSISFSGKTESIAVKPWIGEEITLEVPNEGATFVLYKDVGHNIIKIRTLQ
ncbi:hypothetical protein ACFL1S_04390 [Pseudomonadota bacterium]